jgi:hypothetical protein
MSEEHVAVVRGAIDDWNRRDWKAWMAKHDADMVAVPHRDWPEPEATEGAEAWFHRVQQMLEPWDEQRLEIDDAQSSGDVVVLTFRWVARGRRSQIDVDIPMVANYTVADGLIKHIDFFFDISEALEAVGLRPALSQDDLEEARRNTGEAIKLFETGLRAPG